MLLMDWLRTLRNTFATFHFNKHLRHHRHARRNMKPGFAVAAEVLPDRTPPSESVVSLVGGSLLMGLSPSLGEASAAVVEEESDPFQSTFIGQPDNTDLSEFSTQEAESSAQAAVAPQSTADSAQTEVLPAVLDELLSSAFHEPVPTSPPSTELPELPLTEIQESGPNGSFVPSSNANTGSPAPTGGAESESFGSGTLSARQHGGVQPLGIASTGGADASPDSSGTLVSTLNEESGGSGGSGGMPTVTVVRGNDAWESPQPADKGTFIFSRDYTEGALTVNFSMSGDAEYGGTSSDYSSDAGFTTDPNTGAVTGSVMFADGVGTAAVEITAIDDSVAEEREHVILTLTEGTGYALGTETEAKICIHDEAPGGSGGECGKFINLEIYNGQHKEGAKPVENESTVGAFTVANLNDTDGDGDTDDDGDVDVVDKDDTDVVKTGNNRDEVDLMKLVLHKPEDQDGPVKLIVSGDGAANVKLWESSTKGTPIPLTNGEASFPISDLDKTIWVELTAGSTALRDVTLTMRSHNGNEDVVKATGIWVTRTGFRNSNDPTTLTGSAMNTNPASTQIEVADASGLANGDHIILFKASDNGATRDSYKITAVNGKILTLNEQLGRAWAEGDEVREGASPNVDDASYIRQFSKFGGKLGAEHISPVTNNFMEMEFTVGPHGIADQPGVVFDISRQVGSVFWVFDGQEWGEIASQTKPMPQEDELPNDDGNNDDEDADPIENTDKIYVIDGPGLLSDTAFTARVVLRANFHEFVRVKFDGTPFEEKNETQGSRASDNVKWYTRLDVLGDATTKMWTRNNNQPAGQNENEIVVGQHKDLLQNDPRS